MTMTELVAVNASAIARMHDPNAADDPHCLLALRGIAKAYPLVDTARRKIGALVSLLRQRHPAAEYVALKNIDLTVYRGQSLGLVGVNGAGKSTLMKIMAGVIKPSAGNMLCRGRVGALLELGAGFHPEYSGLDNVHLACSLMGFSPEQTRERLDEILAFADIGQHIHQPIKHYSSGMVVRLGFAVSTTLSPDLLITDEVLAVGDESFQKKCSRWMERYLNNGGTLILCSHSMYHIQKLCTHAAWLHEGVIREYGESGDITRSYLAWHEARNAADSPTASDVTPRAGNGAVYHIQETWLNGLADDRITLRAGEELIVAGTAYSPDGREPVIATSIVKPDGAPVFGTFSDIAGYRAQRQENGLMAFEIRYPRLALLPGSYRVRLHAMDPEGLRLFDHIERGLDITGGGRHMGVCLLDHEWRAPSTFGRGETRGT